MTDAHHVNVFNFRLPQGHLENQRVAPFKATLARIRALGGELLPATREQVPSEDIDADGRYHRIPTGWGGLS